jgi:ferredoxin
MRGGGDVVHVEIDSTKCSGHGQCYSLAPGAFDCDDEGFGIVIGSGDLDDALRAEARRGADSCPERAITVS